MIHQLSSQSRILSLCKTGQNILSLLFELLLVIDFLNFSQNLHQLIHPANQCLNFGGTVGRTEVLGLNFLNLLGNALLGLVLKHLHRISYLNWLRLRLGLNLRKKPSDA